MSNADQLSTGDGSDIVGGGGGVTFAAIQASLALATSAVGFNGQKIVNVADPTNPTDVANKEYVDSVATGLAIKAAVRAISVGALPAYTRVANVITANANGALPAQDGVSLLVADRFLLKDGASGVDNGIYVATSLGSGGSAFVLTRSSDANTSPQVTSGMFAFVTEGSILGGSSWVLSTPDPIVLNTTALTFAQFSSAGVITAGTGLQKVGSVISIANAGVGTTQLANLAVTDAKVATANIDGLFNVPSLRTLGTGSQQAAAGNDSRISGAEQTANKNTAGGYAGLDGSSKLTGSQQVYGTTSNTAAQGNDSRITGAEQTTNKGAVSGYASLDGTTKVPIAQIPTGVTGSTVALGNDSRLSDSRTPLAHAASHNAGGSDALAIDASAAVGSFRTLGTGALQAAAGNDSRILGAEQTANKNTAAGYAGLDGSTKILGSQIPYGTTAGTAAQGNDSRITGAEQTANKGAASGYASLDGTTKVPIAQIPTGTTGSTVPFGNDSRFSDSRTPLAHAASHNAGGADVLAIDAAAGVGSFRTLGTGALQAAAGNDSRIVGAEQTANKNQPNGYAGLDGSSKLAGSQQVYGTTSNTAAQGNDSRITGAEQTANKNQPSGYAGLDGSSKLTGSQQVYGTTSNTATQGNDSRVVNAVQTSRQINTTGPITGGGPLSTDLTLAFSPSADVPFNSHKITGLLDPTTAQDGATKAYVDTVAQGLLTKAPARLATAVALPANAYVNGVLGVGATLTGNSNGALTVDGVLVNTSDRLLIKNEATSANDGIYTVTQTGTGLLPYILTRSSDMNQASEFPGAYVLSIEGTVNTGTSWVLVADPDVAFVVGTTSQTWVQFSGLGDVITTAPLSKSGNTISLNFTAALNNNGGNLDVTGAVSSVPILTDASSATAGSANSFLRTNAQQILTTAAPVAVGAANAQGTSTSGSRADHVHQAGANKIVSGLTTTAMSGGAGQIGYLSGTNTVTPTDSSASASFPTFGVYNGVSGQMVTSGPITVQFTTIGGAPTANQAVYFAASGDEASAVGKATATPPVDNTIGAKSARIGICLDPSNYAGSKTAIVLLQESETESPSLLRIGQEFSDLSINDIGMNTSSGGSASAVNFTSTGVAGHPGICTLKTGTTSTGFAGLEMPVDHNQPSYTLGTTDMWSFECYFQLPSVSNSTDRFRFEFGFFDSAYPPANGVTMSYKDDVNSGNVVATASKSSTTTTLNGSVSFVVGAGVWYRWRIKVDAVNSLCTFYVNGISMGTISTNIPVSVSSLYGFCGIVKTLGTSQTTVLVDYIWISMPELVAATRPS